MSCTRILPMLFMLLAGCTVLPRLDPGPDAPAGTSPLSSSADREVAQYRDAISALNNSQLEFARAELQKITRNRPGLAGPWINLALIDIRKNDMENAMKNVANALERNPKMPQAFNLRGYIELSRGNVIKAADDYRQAIALREGYAIAHYNLALVHDIYFQDLKVATRHYKRYLELTNNQDRKTAEWVAELERLLSKEKQ